jgi:hypothetical protein
MKNIIIDGLDLTTENNCNKLLAKVSDQKETTEIWFKIGQQNLEINQSADPFVPVILFCAMKRGLNILLQSAVSENILIATQKVQLVKNNWDKSWSIIKFEAQEKFKNSIRLNHKKGVGLFFSGGVDSFYTLKKHRDEITHLIFVQGFDIPVNKTKYNKMVSTRLRKVVEALNLEFVEVKTNIRQYSDRYVHWEDYHGAAMAAVAYFLAPNFVKIYIPSSYNYAFLFPYGSHPGLDPLWGNNHLQLIHDGCESSRFDKIKEIANWDLVLDNLRVCWQVKEGQYNCCQCRKCLWTMAFLRTINKLPEAKTFSKPFNLEVFSQLIIDNLDHRFRILQAIAILEERGDDPELLEAMQKALNRKNYWLKAKNKLKHLTQKLLKYIRNRISS